MQSQSTRRHPKILSTTGTKEDVIGSPLTWDQQMQVYRAEVQFGLAEKTGDNDLVFRHRDQVSSEDDSERPPT